MAIFADSCGKCTSWGKTSFTLYPRNARYFAASDSLRSSTPNVLTSKTGLNFAGIVLTNRSYSSRGDIFSRRLWVSHRNFTFSYATDRRKQAYSCRIWNIWVCTRIGRNRLFSQFHWKYR